MRKGEIETENEKGKDKNENRERKSFRVDESAGEASTTSHLAFLLRNFTINP